MARVAHRSSRWLGLVLSGLCGICVVTLLGCASGATIGAVTATPAEFQDAEVSLRGTVTEIVTVPFARRSVFRLQDSTGAIWVLGVGDAPKRDDDRTVTGTVRTGITIGTRTFGVLLKELEREKDSP